MLEDVPTLDIAKPAAKEPEILNTLVKNTLEKLGEYKHQP